MVGETKFFKTMLVLILLLAKTTKQGKCRKVFFPGTQQYGVRRFSTRTTLIRSTALLPFDHAADETNVLLMKNLQNFKVSFNIRIAKSLYLETNQFFRFKRNLILNETFAFMCMLNLS